VQAQVYLVTNNLNGKQYVGQTINPHLPMGHGRIMKAAYKKHGKENFTYEPICTQITNRSGLNTIERFWISVMDTIVPNGYNIDLGGSEGSTWTEERRKRISIARTGKKLNRPLGSKSGANSLSARAYFPVAMRIAPASTTPTLISSSNMSGSTGNPFSITTLSETVYQNAAAAGHAYAYWTFDVSAEL
jgi:hypothetical protein